MNKTVKVICEAAVLTAASLALSYLKIPLGFTFGGFGGSVDLVMIPIILLAVRHGLGWGVASGIIFGTLKFFFAGGVAVNWQSMLLDYTLAYGAVGLAGVFKNRENGLLLGGLTGCIARFGIHFLSGVTIYAEYMPEEFFNMTMTSPAIYSVLYNGSYMLPNTVLVVIAAVLLKKPLRDYIIGAK